jgi:hypothetical protein
MHHRRLIRGDSDSAILTVRNVGDNAIPLGGAAVFAYSRATGYLGWRYGDAVYNANNAVGHTVSNLYWLIAGIVVNTDIPVAGHGQVCAYGHVDSILVSGWTGTWTTAHPDVHLLPVSTVVATKGYFTPTDHNINSPYEYDGVAIFPGSSVLNDTSKTVTNGTGYIRGFIRAL